MNNEFQAIETEVKALQQPPVKEENEQRALYQQRYNDLMEKVELAQNDSLILVCGRYEGIDERFIEQYVDEIFSIGDFVLTGGELAIQLMIDSSVRFIPGVLGNKVSAEDDSFEDGLVEGPQYTRPREFNGVTPPKVLMDGHHARINEFILNKKL